MGVATFEVDNHGTVTNTFPQKFVEAAKLTKISQFQTMIAEKYTTYILDFLHGARYMPWGSESTFRLIFLLIKLLVLSNFFSQKTRC